ncbi:hypothetical protein [Streptomyces sp. NPDC013455]|uniref:hypothetical protein n=1 Tax=Streptomyces sp. NPDC013455 TaxID=3155605 RepID=UPI003403026A
MVFRSIWQGLQNLGLTGAPGAEAAGMSDEELKSLAMQNPEHTRNLIAIEKARHAWKVQVALIAGGVLLVALAMTAWTLVSLHAAGHLKLPWPKPATVVATLMSTTLITAVTALLRRRRKERRAAATAPANQAQNGAQGDQNQVGAP